MTRIVLVALAVGALAIGAVVVSAQGADEGWRVTVRFEYAPDYGIGIYSYHHGDGVFRSAENPATGEFYFAPNDNGVITAVRTFTIPAPDAPPADDSAIRELRAERARLTTALDAANAELITARAQRDTFERERDAARSESDTLKAQLATARQELITVRAERDEAREQVRTLTAQLAAAPTPTPEPVVRAPHISCSDLYDAAYARIAALRPNAHGQTFGIDRAIALYEGQRTHAGWSFTFLGGHPAHYPDAYGHFHNVLGCSQYDHSDRWTCSSLHDALRGVAAHARSQAERVLYLAIDRSIAGRPSVYGTFPVYDHSIDHDRRTEWQPHERSAYTDSLAPALTAFANAACSAAR